MSKEIRMTKPEAVSFHGNRLLPVWMPEKCASIFVIPPSSFFRHSSFCIRHSLSSHPIAPPMPPGPPPLSMVAFPRPAVRFAHYEISTVDAVYLGFDEAACR
jgi:hypothetical protein